MKKVLIILLALVMAFSFVACGGGEGGSAGASAAVEEAVGAPVTPETYEELTEGDWSEMSLEDYNDYFGSEGVVDEERTEEWGEGYLVVDWYDDDGSGNIHILFEDKDGTYMPSSISSSFPE